jgi:hypothetical protein
MDFRPDGTWELTGGPSEKSGKMTQVSSGLYSTTAETLTWQGRRGRSL